MIFNVLSDIIASLITPDKGARIIVMPDSPQFSQEGHSNLNRPPHGGSEEKPQIHYPEFVLIDERNGEEKTSYFGRDPSQYSQKNYERSEEGRQPPKGTLSLRFICFLGFVFCMVFGGGMLLLSIIMSFLAALSLFQNPKLNQGMWRFWKFFTNTLIAGFGFTLGMISPTLGLGLLAIYFSLASNLADDDILRRVIRRSFNHL